MLKKFDSVLRSGLDWKGLLLIKEDLIRFLVYDFDHIWDLQNFCMKKFGVWRDFWDFFLKNPLATRLVYCKWYN